MLASELAIIFFNSSYVSPENFPALSNSANCASASLFRFRNKESSFSIEDKASGENCCSIHPRTFSYRSLLSVSCFCNKAIALSGSDSIREVATASLIALVEFRANKPNNGANAVTHALAACVFTFFKSTVTCWDSSIMLFRSIIVPVRSS